MAKKKAKRNVRKEVQRALRKLRLNDTQIANVTMEFFIGACMRLGFSEKETVAYLRKEAKCLYSFWEEQAEAEAKSAAAYLSDEEQSMVNAATALASGLRVTKHQRELAERAVAVGLVEPLKSKTAKRAAAGE